MSGPGADLQASLWSFLLPASLWLHLPPLSALRREGYPTAAPTAQEGAGTPLTEVSETWHMTT